jgi:hypothetical protein
MGCTTSVDLSSQAQASSDFFCVQFCKSGRFNFISASEEVIELAKFVISQFWTVESESRSPGFLELKLTHLHSFNSAGEKSKKYFICCFINEFYKIGWHFKTAIDLQYRGPDSDLLIFYKAQPIQTSVICLSLYSNDKISVFAPQDVCDFVKRTIIESWPRGIQQEQTFDKGLVLKLNGKPFNKWNEDSTDSLNSPVMVCDLINILFKNGWTFIGSIDTFKSYMLPSLYFRFEIQHDAQNVSFFALSLNKSNIIRLHNVTNDLMSLISNISYGLPSFWKPGVVEQRLVNSKTLEFKLKGNLWNWQAKGYELIDSRRLINNILNLFARSGWNLYATSDLTNHSSNKTIFIFRSTPIEVMQFKNFCLSLSDFDKIRIIDNQMNIKDEIRLAIEQTWPKGIQSESDYYNSVQFKLKGYPFSGQGAEHINACLTLATLLNRVEKQGFKLLANGQVINKRHKRNEWNNPHPCELDTLFFGKTY